MTVCSFHYIYIVYNVINVINQLKKWKKRTDVDAILNQIIKNNDCVDINKDFLAARLNYLLEHNVIVKKKYNNIESCSLYENTQTRDLTEILSSCTPDIQIPDASIDPNEVLINATPEGSPNIPTIDTPTCSNLPYNCPSQPYSLTSLKQNYLDLCAQSVDVKEFLFRETELEMKVSFFLYQSNVTSVSSDHNNFQKLNHCNKNQLEKLTFSFQETNDKSCENSNRSNAAVTLQNLRLENPNRIMIGQLNINSIRNKFEMLTSLIANEIDVLLLSETKLDETFPLEQFLISGFAKPLRLDRNSKGGGIMLFIRDNIPFRLLKHGNLPSNTEAFFIEINLRKKKWLMCCGYNPNKSLINKFTHDIGKVLDSFIGNYDNFLIVGDLNSEIGESSIHDFCNSYNLHSLCHKSTCYKNPEKPSCIDLFLTNSPKSFQNTQTIETGLSDFHKLVVTILKMYLPNNQPKVITYRDYKNFDNSHFSEELLYEIKKLGPLNKNISIFHHTCIAVLEKYAPEKRKYIRANQANFMDSKLNHAIMLRSKLRNKFLKSRSNKDGEAYKKQRNLCVSLLRQNKKDYFETLDMKSVTDNKMFWKTVAQLFSNKSKASNKITLSENEKLITNDQKSAEVFNNYFNSIVEELNIPIDQNLLNDASLFDDPIIAAIHKYKRHPSILKIKEQLKKDDLFSFYHVNPDKMLKIIENTDSKKATQHGDIPVRIIKENKFIFSKVLSEIFNFYIDNNTFPNDLKKADIIPIYKKDDPFDKTNYRPISILPVLSKPFERCLYDQIYEYIDTILSKVQCGFRKGFTVRNIH